MNLKYIGLSFLTIFFTNQITAQNKAYFQQQVNHTIAVELDDVNHFLNGTMSMDYTNNSNDTLSYIYMHLYPNAYSVDNSAYSIQSVENKNTKHYLSPKSNWGYMDSLNFVQDGIPLKVALTDNVDVIRIMLVEPILPGASTTIVTPFRVKLPKTFSRIGHEDNSYQITQWYPKPAVYDADGWHPYTYLDQGEFYSEYGNYDVSITLPENYLVMATGNLITESEKTWLNQKAHQALLDSFNVKIPKKVASSTNKKTIQFQEQNVHDFAWFADKRWLLRIDTVVVPKSNTTTQVYVAYPPESHNVWKTAVDATKNAVKLYSNKVGPYPYKTVKVVEGALKAGGGMEYPTITVIAPGNGGMNDLVIIHEVGHNWFQGILGSNERLYPWMDEGINSFYEKKVALDSSISDSKLNKVFSEIQDKVYALTMAKRTSLPIGLNATEYTNSAYGIDVYGKSPAYLLWLEQYMGSANFDNAMQEYFSTWKFKHPQPKDFELIIRKYSPKNLDWFFTNGIYSDKPVDFKISGIKKNNTGKEITLKNKTGFYGPAAVVLDDSGQLYWTEPFVGKTKINIKNEFSKATIADAIPDYNLSNNSSKKGFKVKPFFSLKDDYSKRLFIAPALGYNVYDRFMLGLTFHNYQIPEKSFQYILAPMYGFGSKTFVGTGLVSKAFYPSSNIFQEIDFNLEAKRFSNNRTFLENYDNPRQQYLKVAPELRLVLKKQYYRSPVDQYVSLRGYYIQEGTFDFNRNPTDSNYYPSKGADIINYYGKIKYQYNNNRTFNPYDFNIEAQIGKTFAKLSAEANLKIDYFYKKKAFYIRVFGGKMFNFDNADYNYLRYSFAATYSGWNDYLYDQTYIGRNRNQTLASQQIYIKDGGLKVPTLMYANQVGVTNNWMFATNLRADLPIGIPVQIFADFLRIADAENVNNNQSKWLYDVGLSLRVLNFMDIYVPVFMSKEYTEYKKSVLGSNSFLKSVTFKFDLDKFYWSRIKLPF